MTSNNSSSINNPDSFDQDDKEAANQGNHTESESYDELVGLSGGASDGNGEDSSDNGDMARIGRSGNNGNNNSNKKSFVDKERKRIYVQKYNTGIPLSEAVIVGGYPFFLRLKNGELVLTHRIELSNLIINPPDSQSQLSEPYVFESKDEIVHYVDLAKKISNFDQLFNLIKSIYKKHVDAEEHYIVLLAADTIYSYFQHKFATTHYVICIGDNSSGKNSILTSFKYLGYRVLLATGVSPANIYTLILADLVRYEPLIHNSK